MRSQKIFSKFIRTFSSVQSEIKTGDILGSKSDVNKFISTKFQNENIVITGGAAGLGKILAGKLGRLKASVAIWDDNKEALDETFKLAKVTGTNVFTYFCDLSRKDEIYATAEKTKREIGPVTMVINNAEFASEKLFLDTPDCVIQRAFDINTLSHFWTTKAFLPNMVEGNKGHIVTISSMAGHMGIQKLTDYCATKAAATNFLTALKTELDREGSTGIKTTIICPYFMQTQKLHGSAKLRLIRGVTPEEVADRTIKAIIDDEQIVFMPSWFKYALLGRWICPTGMASLCKRILIKDPNTASSVQAGPMKIVQLVDSMRSKKGKKVPPSNELELVKKTQKR